MPPSPVEESPVKHLKTNQLMNLACLGLVALAVGQIQGLKIAHSAQPPVQAAEKKTTKNADGDQANSAPADKAKKPSSEFTRLRKDDTGQPKTLDTAVVRYQITVGSKTATVDLVGAIHIGEKSYYDTLNKKLGSYDAVLYELVAPKGTRIPKGGRRSNHPVSMLQRGMKQLLGLEFQLEQIDYSPKSFVHADLSPQEFAQSMKDRNESFFKLIMRAMKQSMKQQLDDNNDSAMPSDLDVLRALFAKDRALKMKRLMAGQLANIESQLAVLQGPDGSTLITERNKRALEVLREEVAKGKQRVAIFYGAGHMPDMETRLKQSFAAKRLSTEWITAWNMED